MIIFSPWVRSAGLPKSESFITKPSVLSSPVPYVRTVSVATLTVPSGFTTSEAKESPIASAEPKVAGTPFTVSESAT